MELHVSELDLHLPVLRAGGAEVLIDRERFAVGRALLGQMDAVQDAAEVHLLVLSPDYLAVEEEGRYRLRAPIMARWLRRGA